jgi:ParB family chromosome partitioning protein
MNDKDSAIIAIIENIQRQDLNFLEEAEGIQDLIRTYGYTQEQIAQTLSKGQSTVANKLRILKMPRNLLSKIIEANLTERHARALLRLSTEELQERALSLIIENNLNVKQAEDLIDGLAEGKEIIDEKGTVEKKKKAGKKLKFLFRDTRILANTLESAVESIRESGFPTEYIYDETDDGCRFTIEVKYPK